ncbi:MAG: hypothetical protein M0038_06690 [Pseudomonadota bacterium]|jgi:hypothetical protein|nr:hypothetical protein [Pseudomonadota bacterium]
MTVDVTRLPELTDETPCDRCPNFNKCATQLLACSAFSMFVNSRRWRNATRVPSAEQFAAIYNSGRARDEDELIEFRKRVRRTHNAHGTRPGRKPRAMETTCSQSL